MHTINVEKDVSIRNVKGFYKDVVESLGKEDEVTIDLKDVESIDFSVAQVIMAARKHAKKNRKLIRIRNVSKAVKGQFKNCCLIKS